jgi:hypothetical protein
MGECLAAEAPAAVNDYVDTAMRIFEEVGARNGPMLSMAGECP